MTKILQWIGTYRRTKQTAVEKLHEKELAEAKLKREQCLSAVEYYQSMAEMYATRIDRIEGNAVDFRVWSSTE